MWQWQEVALCSHGALGSAPTEGEEEWERPPGSWGWFLSRAVGRTVLCQAGFPRAWRGASPGRWARMAENSLES